MIKSKGTHPWSKQEHMPDLILQHDYQGNAIAQRKSDGFVRLNEMASAEGKRVGDYLDLPGTKEYITALAKDLSLLPDNLVVKKEGRNGGTWAHPEIAIDFARWVSIPFRIWANRTLREVIAGNTSKQQVIQACIVKEPTPWFKRFEWDYYDHLSRLTGLQAQGHKRPALWGALTKELVYDFLPNGVTDALLDCRAKHGKWEKLHQFLSGEGVRLFENHMRSLQCFMLAASSLDDLRRLLQQSKTRAYQLLLFVPDDFNDSN